MLRCSWLFLLILVSSFVDFMMLPFGFTSKLCLPFLYRCFLCNLRFILYGRLRIPFYILTLFTLGCSFTRTIAYSILYSDCFYTWRFIYAENCILRFIFWLFLHLAVHLRGELHFMFILSIQLTDYENKTSFICISSLQTFTAFLVCLM